MGSFVSASRGVATHQRPTPRCGSLLLSIYADVRSTDDDVIANEGQRLCDGNLALRRSGRRHGDNLELELESRQQFWAATVMCGVSSRVDARGAGESAGCGGGREASHFKLGKG